MSKYVMAMTYKPKIEGVFNGTIRQTIRKGRKYKVGDEILFHTWEGKPYFSKWGLRKRVVLDEVYTLELTEDGVINEHVFFCTWNAPGMEILASNDGISPATGEELKRLLKGESPNSPIKGKHDWEGDYQVLRW